MWSLCLTITVSIAVGISVNDGDLEDTAREVSMMESMVDTLRDGPWMLAPAGDSSKCVMSTNETGKLTADKWRLPPPKFRNPKCVHFYGWPVRGGRTVFRLWYQDAVKGKAVLGKLGSMKCALGQESPDREDKCFNAAKKLGLTFSGAISDKTRPEGCYTCEGGTLGAACEKKAWLNTVSGGTALSTHRPICEISGTPVLAYDPEGKSWISKQEDRWDKKQLFESGDKPGHWCLVYDNTICFKLSGLPTTTTITTTTTTTVTTTSGPSTTTTTYSTTTVTYTTTTTITLPPPMWVKGEIGKNCMAVCGVGDWGGPAAKCLEDRWPVTREAFEGLLNMIDDTSCTSIEESNDWEEWPGQYDETACYYRTSPSNCAAGHYAVSRYCPCQGLKHTTTDKPIMTPAPEAPEAPEAPAEPKTTAKPETRRRGSRKGTRRRRNKKTRRRRNKGKGGKTRRRRRNKKPKTTTVPPTEAPTEPPTEAPTEAPATELPPTEKSGGKRRRRRRRRSA